MVDEELISDSRLKQRKLLEISQNRVGNKRALAGDDKRLLLETISTDIPQLDVILGGGWRRGRMGMLVGEASMGKTLIMQWTIAAFQSRGLSCGFIDPEKTYDPDWFAVTGVDVESLIVARPENTEQAFDLAIDWAENGMDLIGFDSLAALTPKMRAASGLEEQEVMGASARKISEGLNLLTNKNHDSMILCTNQLRSKMGVVYGSPDTIPGGRAQLFYASYGLKVRRGGWITEGDKRIGYVLKVETFKNKVAPPFQVCEIPFLFEGTIDTIAGLVDTGIELGLITGKRGFYKWGDVPIRGLVKLKQYFTDNPEEQEKLKYQIEHDEILEDGEIKVI